MAIFTDFIERACLVLAWQETKWFRATVDLTEAHGTDEAGHKEWNVVYQRQVNVPRAKVRRPDMYSDNTRWAPRHHSV